MAARHHLADVQAAAEAAWEAGGDVTDAVMDELACVALSGRDKERLVVEALRHLDRWSRTGG